MLWILKSSNSYVSDNYLPSYSTCGPWNLTNLHFKFITHAVACNVWAASLYSIKLVLNIALSTSSFLCHTNTNGVVRKLKAWFAVCEHSWWKDRMQVYPYMHMYLCTLPPVCIPHVKLYNCDLWSNPSLTATCTVVGCCWQPNFAQQSHERVGSVRDYCYYLLHIQVFVLLLL